MASHRHTGNYLACPHCPYEGSQRGTLKPHREGFAGPHCSYEGSQRNDIKIVAQKLAGPHCLYERDVARLNRGTLRDYLDDDALFTGLIAVMVSLLTR